MKVLLIGSGGRESALAYKIRQSSLLTELKVYPGNGGFPRSEVIPKNSFNLKDKSSTIEFVKKEKFDLVVVGPEDPLVDGITDWMEEAGVLCFGPSAYCARIEGSKDFAKNLMKEFNVPTAAYAAFTDYDSAIEYTRKQKLPLVVKADGLAAGKGVTVCLKPDEFETALKEIFLDKKFGTSGSRVLIEEFMEGQEASIFAISDGEKYLVLPALQDHKRAFDGDRGPNTGGMGAYCPAPIATDSVIDQVKREVFTPMIEGLKKKGTPYKGLLYAGLMIDSSGYAKVVEFNCRFGDPETQSLMLMIEDDLLKLMKESAEGNIHQDSVRLKKGASCVVVLAAKGYPEDYIKNIELNLSKPGSDTEVFHAGTTIDSNGKLLSSGGRILGISSFGESLKSAVSKCYAYIDSNQVPNTFYRKDIAGKAL